MIKDEIISVAKPILFNTEMVRAILDGRKTQTRRIVVRDIVKAHKWLTARGHWNGGQDIPEDVLEIYVREVAPQYRVGDCLYVRETWTTYYQGGKKHYIYRAGDFNKKVLEEVGNAKLSWLPSIHMPKEAARIFLRVTDISVERLQDIDDDGVNDYGYMCCNEWQEDEAAKASAARLNKLTKKALLELSQECFGIVLEWIDIKTDYERLSSTMDVLRGKTGALLAEIRKIEQLYDKADKAGWYDWKPEVQEFNRVVSMLPDTMWVE